jgi:threonine/homoserine/homoserine lactone efflux protein
VRAVIAAPVGTLGRVPAPSTLAVFALAALALIAIPGPNLLYIASRSMSDGRRAGIASALGVETGTIVHVTAAAAGLSALIASSAAAFDAIRYLGAAYLIFLGIRTLMSRDDDAEHLARPVSLARAYRQAVVVQVLNPKVALFFLAFLPQFVDPDRGPVATQVLVLGAVLGALGFAVDCAYALAAARLGRFKHRRRVSGGIYLVLGAAAALTGRR